MPALPAQLGLAPVYLFYYAALGILIPYWSPYLKSIGLAPVQIGQLTAIYLAWRLVAPPAWGWLADHSGRRMGLVRAAAVAGALAFAAIGYQSTFWSLALCLSVFAVFWTALLPQYEVNTLSVLGTRIAAYGRIRLWGSVGFILAVTLGGWWFSQEGIGSVPVIITVLACLVALSSFLAPVGAVPARDTPSPSFIGLLGERRVIALLLVSMLMQAAFGPYYVFFTLYLEQLGYSRLLIGLLWALGVAAEILVFIYSPWLFQRFRRRVLLGVALACTVLRWGIMAGAARHLWLLFIAQVLHMASFGLFHAVAVVCIHEFFPGRTHGRGQALYSSVGFGAGGALGSLYSGYVWAIYGPPAMFWMAAALVLAASLVAALWLKPCGDETPRAA